MDLLQDHRRPLKVRKTTSGRWLMPVLEPVKLVSYGNLVLSALRTEEKGETKKEKEKKKRHGARKLGPLRDFYGVPTDSWAETCPWQPRKKIARGITAN